MPNPNNCLRCWDGDHLAGSDQGWQELAGELLPGTIGAELQEMEETV